MTSPPVEIALSSELVARLETELAYRKAMNRPITMDELITQALGTEVDWARTARRLPAQRARSRMILCDCCRPHSCQHILVWRGKARCACTPDRLKAA